MTILLVEDQPRAAQMLAKGLRVTSSLLTVGDLPVDLRARRGVVGLASMIAGTRVHLSGIMRTR